jgi:pimeloyl-ACP methyl ester carboxylesterase
VCQFRSTRAVAAPYPVGVAQSVETQPVETHYARHGDGHVAYQVLSEGKLDLLVMTYGATVSIDTRDEEPHWARFERRLASFSRLVRFDLSGIGLSDPLPHGQEPTMEHWVGDALAVLDAVGSTQAAVFGSSVGGTIAMVLAATHPERVSALALCNTYARAITGPDYPHGLSPEVMRQFIDDVVATNPAEAGTAGLEAPYDELPVFAPSLAADPAFRAYWRRAGQRGASPATARAHHRLAFSSDVRPYLPAITVPTLVLYRDRAATMAGHAAYLREHIPGAKTVELPGDDIFPFSGDADAVVEEVEEFLTGSRHVAPTERILATMLFTDIAGSTAMAAEVGDRRWRELLDGHDEVVRRELDRCGGRAVKHTGDGVLAVLEGPGRAISCARAVQAGARAIGLEVRAGVHTGEVERRGDDLGGLGVHIAQRISALAAPGEVLVSSTVKELVAGSGMTFEDRGDHEL